MEDAFIGEIRIMGFNYTPMYWAACDGSLLLVSNYQALFSIIGNIYGGDGKNNFAVPDLRGLLPMGAGSGPGLTPRILSKEVGQLNYTLDISTMPLHTHSVTAYAAGVGNKTSPVGNIPAATSGRKSAAVSKYVVNPNESTLVPFNAEMVGTAGTAIPSPVSVLQPSLAMNFCICLDGTYPIRP